MTAIMAPNGRAIGAAVRRSVDELKAALDVFADTVGPALTGEVDEQIMKGPLDRIRAAEGDFHRSLRHVWAACRAAHPETTGIGKIPLDLRTHEVLRREGIKTLADLERGLADGTLSAIPGIGPARLRHIERAVAEERSEQQAESAVA